MEIEELYNRFTECNGLTTDSRHCPEGSMFLALKGETFNGNTFAAQSLAQGCRYAVVDEPQYASPENPRIILVDNCLETLQKLANYHRRRLGTRMIGVTGTNGKTTTKELIATVLGEKFKVLYTQGNFNNHIGVPLTLLRLKPEHEMAVIEMGANHPGEIKTLVHIAEPDYGIITNVGKAHLQGFGSFEGVIRTKGELYDFLREKGNATIFIQNENPYLNKIAAGLTCVRYGQTPGLDVTGKVVACSPFLHFTWTAEGVSHEVQTHLIGAYNLDNALAAVAIGRYFGVEDTQICHALSSYVPQNNRSQLVHTASNTLIVDAYNANPTSMMAALENFRQMEAAHKVAILGDMKELGEGSHEEHQKVVDFLKECGFERVMLVGPEFGGTSSLFEHYKDVKEVEALLAAHPLQGCCVLVKGSNSMKLSELPASL
ncbi:MAG TPA: UDP-N-acetylmuramoyl-tripeptide--D-alanyl-D-alanine ligase [Bacteroides mediterraneensis]|uniref:UDP-N-acetylmuramoyl-tripeptide--D-alanyl-D- alanine ligase n=1 Tax=Bacteroides mediterraneensis TaxID=1841856 RepID=UPI0026021289|nr:UDP-N-acetylmuramoyl-tripeptide--D-alanyl-D-alanine ligase [Bacteroides mediterraneensis]HJH63149.1 UDP-N-acetylmuramoyl-tripeptide--D-alanyl-D-alanine ligase [Bacteroides mediterraneensis]